MSQKGAVSSAEGSCERKRALPKRSVVERFVLELTAGEAFAVAGEDSGAFARSSPLMTSSEKAVRAAIESAHKAS